MKGIKFIKDVNLYSPNNVFIARLFLYSKSKNEILDEISKKLKFPAYFGYNWDALSDCLRDLSWISEYGVVIIHEDLKSIDDETMYNYIQILIDAVKNWKEGEEHYLEVAFLSEFENQIMQILSKNELSTE